MLESQDNEHKYYIPLNYDQLASEIVRYLRGNLNQRDLSKKLGFTFNQVGKWESLVTQIKWDDFLELAAVLNIPIEKYFRDYFFWSNDKEFSPHVSFRALLQYLNIGLPDWQRPKALVDKWVAGTSTPDFSEILKMMNSKPLILIGFLSRFLDCSKLETLQSDYKVTMQRLEAILNSPVSAIVNSALHLESYKKLDSHDEDFLAKESGCSRKEVRDSLALLCRTGVVVFDKNKYHSSYSELSFLRHPKFRAITKYLTDLAASRFSVLPSQGNPANPSISSTRIAAMSSEASKKVMELMVQFHNDVALVVKNDSGVKDHVRLMIQHSFVSSLNAPEELNRNKDS